MFNLKFYAGWCGAKLKLMRWEAKLIICEWLIDKPLPKRFHDKIREEWDHTFEIGRAALDDLRWYHQHSPFAGVRGRKRKALKKREAVLIEEYAKEMARIRPLIDAVEDAEASDGICRDSQSDNILNGSLIPVIDDELTDIRHLLYS